MQLKFRKLKEMANRMRNSTKRIMISSFLIITVILSAIQTAEAVWTNPIQLTNNGSVGEDAEIVIDFDSKGNVHFAHTLTFKALEQNNSLYYGNNSNPQYEWDGFPTSEDEKMELTNRAGSNYELLSVGHPAMAIDPYDRPFIGFEAKLNLTATVATFVSVVNNSESNPNLLRLSPDTTADYFSDGSKYSNIQEINHLGSGDFVASYSGTDPYVIGYEAVNPGSVSNIQKLKYFDVAVQMEYSSPYVYAASGNTLLIINGTDLDNLGDIVGSYGFNQPIDMFSLDIAANTIYVLLSNNVLYSINIANPLYPTLRTSLSLAAGYILKDMTLLNSYVYFAAALHGVLTVYSNLTASTLSLVDTRSSSTSINSIDYNAAGTVLYAAGANGIYVSYLGDPSDPGKLNKTVGTTSINEKIEYDARGVLSDILVYSNQTGVMYLDTSSGIWKGVATTNKPLSVSIEGDSIYVADQGAGVAVINIATGTLTTHWKPGTQDSQSVFATGTNLFVCDKEDEVAVVDITTPGTPITRDTKVLQANGGPTFIGSNRIAYMVDQRYGLVIIDFTLLYNPIVLGIRALGSVFTGDLYVKDGFAYLTGGSDTNGLAILDVSNPYSIGQPIYDTYSAHQLNDIFIQSNSTETWGYATDTTANDLVYFNLTANASELANKQLLGQSFTDPQKIVSNGSSILFISDYLGDVPIVDISSISSPSYVRTQAVTDGARDVAFDQNTLYVARNGSNGISYFDVTDPSIAVTERVVASSQLVNCVAAFSSAAFGGTTGMGIGVFDCSSHDLTLNNPSNHVTLDFYANGTCLAVWEANNGVFYRHIYPDLSRGRIYALDVLIPSNDYPIIKINNFNGTEYIHLLYQSIASGGSIIYRRRVNDSAFGNAIDIDESGTVCRFGKMKARGNTVGIVWVDDNKMDVRVKLSTDNGGTWSSVTEVTNTATINETYPDLYVKHDGFAEIIYQRSSQGNFTVCTRENYDGVFDDREVYLAPKTTTNSQEKPKIAEINGTVAIMCQNYDFVGSSWEAANIYVFGYQTLHFDMADDFMILTIDDDPGGQFLFEGLRISYNTTSSVRMNISIKIVDRVSKIEWINTTMAPFDGVSNRELRFWSPHNYFITNNYYDLYIYNASDISNYSLMVTLESFDIPDNSTYYNLTYHNNYSRDSIYDLIIDPILEYEHGYNFYLDANELENEDDPLLGEFGPSNYADLFYFELKKDRAYNFFLTDTTDGKYVTMDLYHSDIQIINQSESVFTLNSLSNNPTSFLCNKTQVYAAFFEPYYQFKDQVVDYKFYFSAVPLPLDPVLPDNETFYGIDNSTSNGDRELELSWKRDHTDSDITNYIVEIYNSSVISAANLFETMNISKVAFNNCSFNVSIENNYFWRVRGIDDSVPRNNGTWSIISNFKFDRTPPKAPVPVPLNKSSSKSYITLSWAPADDGIFSAEKYFVYMATRPIFVAGANSSLYSDYLVNPKGTKSNFYTVNGSKNYHYYFAIEAIDHVGQLSNLSISINTTVAVGGYVSAVGQLLPVQIGDTLVYEVTYVDSAKKNTNNEPMMTFFYNDFTQGTLFHFWVQDINHNEPYPVKSVFYAKSPLSTNDEWFLVDDETPITIFTMSNDVEYQSDVLALFVRNALPGQVYENRTFTTLWRSGTAVIDVNVFTFFGTLDKDGYQSSISFFVDQKTGILCEMTYYDRVNNYGYALKMDPNGSSLQFDSTGWEYAPIYFLFGLIALAVVVAKVIKKVEYKDGSDFNFIPAVSKYLKKNTITKLGGFIAASGVILSVILIERFSWYTLNMETSDYSLTYLALNAFGGGRLEQYGADPLTPWVSTSFIDVVPGILCLLGGIMCLTGKKANARLGAVIIFAGAGIFIGGIVASFVSVYLAEGTLSDLNLLSDSITVGYLTVTVGLGVGFYLTVIGGLIAIVGSFLDGRKKVVEKKEEVSENKMAFTGDDIKK
jgi:hypothetical protein